MFLIISSNTTNWHVSRSCTSRQTVGLLQHTHTQSTENCSNAYLIITVLNAVCIVWKLLWLIDFLFKPQPVHGTARISPLLSNILFILNCLDTYKGKNNRVCFHLPNRGLLFKLWLDRPCRNEKWCLQVFGQLALSLAFRWMTWLKVLPLW